jgi:hypothetical protein
LPEAARRLSLTRSRLFSRLAPEDGALKRYLLPAVVLLCCALVAAVVFSGLLGRAGLTRFAASGPSDPDPDLKAQELDRHLQSTEAHRELLGRLREDLLARRRTLPDAATVLADFAREHKPEWLHGVGRLYPGRPEGASVAASLVYFTLFRLHDGNPADEETARRLAAEYRACYDLPLTSPKGTSPAPPCWRAAGLVRPGES